MDDELKKHLTKYLEKAESVVNSAGEFAQEQIPDVIQQYMAWIFYSHLFFMVVFCLLLLASLYLLRKLWTWYGASEHHSGDEEGSFIMGSIGLFLLSCAFTFGTTYNAYQVTKCVVAPKVVLLEKAMELVGSSKK